MRLLVIGASGLVGWNLANVARREGHRVMGTFSSYVVPGFVPLDLGSPRELQALVASFEPDALVCCAAWSWVDGCESDPARAFRHNRDFPAAAARVAHAAGAAFVHFSSSYVFDGRSGPYSEQDQPNPISVYAESKLAGEVAVADATHGTALIIRTMGVYGDEPQRKNFVDQLRRNLAAGIRMKIPADQRGNATEAANLATGVLALLEQRASGVWNVAGPNPDLLRSDFARQIARTYGLDESLFDFVTTAELQQPAPRPLHGGLMTAKAEAATAWRPQEWQAAPRVAESRA